jgi:hypothetical protein
VSLDLIGNRTCDLPPPFAPLYNAYIELVSFGLKRQKREAAQSTQSTAGIKTGSATLPLHPKSYWHGALLIKHMDFTLRMSSPKRQ